MLNKMDVPSANVVKCLEQLDEAFSIQHDEVIKVC